MSELILHHAPSKIRVRLCAEGQGAQEREADFACALSDNRAVPDADRETCVERS